MAAKSRGRHEISVSVVGEAEFGRARKDIAKDLDKIADAAEDTAKDIGRAFDKLSPELDTSDIKRALDLAGQLDGMVANLTVDTDLSEIQEAEKIARSLRAFQGRVDLSVEGREELSDALNLAEKMDQIRSVKVQVQGIQDLERAEKMVRDIDGRRISIPVDVDARDLNRLDSEFKDAGGSAGEAFASGFDITDIGGSLTGQLSGMLASAGPLAAVLGPLAVAFGDDLMAGISRGFSSNKNMLLTELETNFSAADLAPMGEAAGKAYADGFGDGVRELTVHAATLETALGNIDEAMDLTQTLKAASALDEYLGISIPESSVLAARMIRQGLAEDTVEAFDIMAYASRQYGETGIESLEIMKEFGGVIGRLGLDGAASIDFINQAFVTGLLPTIDRGGEVFEEFHILMTEGSDEARGAVELLGLDFEQMQAQIIQGGEPARQAMELITGGLLNVKDETAQTEAALALFGMTIESATDKPEVIQALHDLTTAQLDLSGQTEEVIEKVEGMQTQFDKASKRVEEFGVIIGADLAQRFNELYDGAGTVIGVLKQLEEAMYGAEIEAKALESQASYTGTVIGDDLSRHALFGRDAVEELTGEVESLAAELDRFGDRFDADQVFRRLESDIDQVIEATLGLTAEAYNLTDGFDITTEAGRRAEAALEDLSGSLDDQIVLFGQGKISAEQLASEQGKVEAAVRKVAAQMGLNEEATEAMVATYATVPNTIRTDATLDNSQAMRSIAELIGQFGALKATASTGVRIGGSGTATTSSTPMILRSITRRASGGPTTGLTLVGEEGPEFVNFGSRSAYVHDANTTSRMMSPGGGTGGGRVVLEINSSGSPMDDVLVEVLRKAIRNRGGSVEAVLG